MENQGVSFSRWLDLLWKEAAKVEPPLLHTMSKCGDIWKFHQDALQESLQGALSPSGSGHQLGGGPGRDSLVIVIPQQAGHTQQETFLPSG